jgi:four helix bundle protein
MSVGQYSELKVWHVGMALVVEIYRVTAQLPRDERYGLVQQMRRAAISVTSNIAEGHTRRSRRDFIRFLSIALGSLAELESQLLVANRLQWLTSDSLLPALSLVSQTGRMLRKLERALDPVNAVSSR